MTPKRPSLWDEPQLSAYRQTQTGLCARCISGLELRNGIIGSPGHLVIGRGVVLANIAPDSTDRLSARQVGPSISPARHPCRVAQIVRNVWSPHFIQNKLFFLDALLHLGVDIPHFKTCAKCFLHKIISHLMKIFGGTARGPYARHHWWGQTGQSDH